MPNQENKIDSLRKSTATHENSDSDPSSEFFVNYASQYKRGGIDDLIKPIQEVRALCLERLPRWIGSVPKNARILDAGCATGYLLSLLHAEGFTNLTGVELSNGLAVMARTQLPQLVQVVQSDVRDYLKGCKNGAFDVILFHHVLEHIPREHATDLLREFHRCLAPNGYLSIRVPNAAFILAGWHCFGDFTHVVHFNERSLQQVLEAAGFDLDSLEFIQHPPKLFWSWRHSGRAMLRLFNRGRWSLQCLLHKSLCLLTDLRPAPQIFEWEIDAIIRR